MKLFQDTQLEHQRTIEAQHDNITNVLAQMQLRLAARKPGAEGSRMAPADPAYPELHAGLLLSPKPPVLAPNI